MRRVLLTLTTTHEPATDLGYLLVKHPDRVHAFDVPTGTAYVCYPEATDAALHGRAAARGRPGRLAAPARPAQRPGDFTLGQYVNDRPYAASSLLAAALDRVFRSALRGESRGPARAGRPPPIPLEIRMPALRCRGGAELAERLFAPLGWAVTAAPIPLDEPHPEWGASRYVDLDADRHAAAGRRAQPPLRAAAGARRRQALLGRAGRGRQAAAGRRRLAGRRTRSGS